MTDVISEIFQVIGVLFILLGAAVTMVTAIGMVRLTGLFSRIHASAKPQVLGVILMCIGLSCVIQNTRVAATLFLVVILQIIAAPISAHILSRAAYRVGRVDMRFIISDDYARDIDKAMAEVERRERGMTEQPSNSSEEGSD